MTPLRPGRKPSLLFHRTGRKLNTLLATLQLVNRVCDAAISLSDEEMKNLSWTSFAADCVETELIQYLKERRLYVNEPVSMAEEV